MLTWGECKTKHPGTKHPMPFFDTPDKTSRIDLPPRTKHPMQFLSLRTKHPMPFLPPWTKHPMPFLPPGKKHPTLCLKPMKVNMYWVLWINFETLKHIWPCSSVGAYYKECYGEPAKMRRFARAFAVPACIYKVWMKTTRKTPIKPPLDMPAYAFKWGLLSMYQKIIPKSHEPTHNFIYPRQESSHIPKSYFRGNAHPQFSGSAALKLKMLVKYPARIPKFHNSRSRKPFFNYRFL